MKKIIEKVKNKIKSMKKPQEIEEMTKEDLIKLVKKKDKKINELKEKFFESLCYSVSTRRSVRDFSSKDVEFKKILELVKASFNAPCAGNIQNYKVVIVKDEKKICELAKDRDQYWMERAKYVIAILRNDKLLKDMFPSDYLKYSLQNTSALAQNMITLISAARFGCCWVDVFSKDIVSGILDITHLDYIPDILIPIGDINSPSKHVEKENSYNLIYYNKYDQFSFKGGV